MDRNDIANRDHPPVFSGGLGKGILISGQELAEIPVLKSLYDVCGSAVPPIIGFAIAVILLSWDLLKIGGGFFILALGWEAFVFGSVVFRFVPGLMANDDMLPLGYIHIAIMVCALIVGIMLLLSPKGGKADPH